MAAKAVESATLEAVDEGLQAVEETVDEVSEQAVKVANKFVRFLKSEGTIRTGIFAVGAAAGFGVYHFVLRAKLETKYERMVAEEIEEARLYFAKRAKVGEFADPVKLAEERLDKIVDDNEYGTGVVPSPELQQEVDERSTRLGDHQALEAPTDETHNVFRDSKSANSHFDYNEEIKNRTELAPYIITQEEFNIGEEGYDQERLTWFDGDDTLLDEQDGIIEDVDTTIGLANLRFGHGSKDNKTVHVRNPVSETDYLVLKSEGTYVKEVLGFDDGSENELKHSKHSGRRHFRHEDE